MELKDLRELLTKRGRISRGARTIRGADNEYLRIEGEEVRDLVLDAVRFRKANGEINYLEISESQISGLHYRNLDADYFSINKSDTRNSSFENVSLYDFGISGGYLRNFKMIDCSFGLHLWNVANAKGLKRISTEIDELLPSGKRFVASPYVREMQGHAMIENCGGKDIEIVRPLGGYVRVGLEHNRFENFRMRGPGSLVKWEMQGNVFERSRISDMVFLDSRFHSNWFIESAFERSIFMNSSFLGSKIELSPEILSCRFLECRFAQVITPGGGFSPVEDALFIYGDKVVVGVSADSESGYLMVDTQLEQDELNPSSAVRQEIVERKLAVKTLFDVSLPNFPGSGDKSRFLHPSDFEMVPFSEVYPELVKAAAERGILPCDHPEFAASRPGCGAVNDFLDRHRPAALDIC
jgi:hypothetical protein